MKAIMTKTEVFEKEGYVHDKEKLDLEIHIHIPFLVDCAKSLRHSAAFKKYSL